MSRSLASLAFLSLLAGVTVAQTRSHPYDLLHVNWHVQLDDSRGAVIGDVTNVMKPERGVTELWLDRGKLAIKRITVNGKTTTFHLVGEQVYFTVPEGMRDGQELSVRVLYSGTPEAGLYFVPASRAFPAHTPVIYTQGEMVDTRYWLVTYDYPDDKATSEGTIDIRKGYFALSNGELLETKDISDKLTRYHWKMDQPHATYLISIVGGPYQKGHEEWDGIPIDFYVPEGMLPWGQVTLQGTNDMVKLYSERTGFKYPYAKFAQTVVPDFMFGGMENITAVTNTITELHPPEAAPIADAEGLILHELAHQWFGDTVTCDGWSDAWINEGWATFMPSFYVRAKHGEEAFDLSRYGTFQGGLGAARSDPTKPVVFTGYKDALDMFNGFIYAGGASRMFMLMNMLGEDRFWACTQKYLEERKYTSINTQDFFETWSKASGRDLTPFMKQWFMSPGAPDLTGYWTGNTLTVKQPAPFFELDVPVWVWNDTEWVKNTVHLSGAEASLTLPALAGKPMLIDPEVWIMASVHYDGNWNNEQKIALFRNAPNAAGKARIMDDMLRALPPAEALAFAKTITSNALLERYLGSLRATPGAEEFLLGLIAKDEQNIRLGAIEQLQEINPSVVAITEAKRLAENDPNPLIRQAAFRVVLNQTKDRTLASRLWTMDSFNDDYRQTALSYWSRTSPDEARVHALEAVRKGLPEPTRVQAIRVLGEVKDAPGERTVYDTLVGVLGETSFGARNAAIGALANYGDKAAIPLLQPFTTNSLVFFRNSARGAIDQLSKPSG